VCGGRHGGTLAVYSCVVDGMAALWPSIRVWWTAWRHSGRLFGVFQAADDCRRDNYRLSALFVQQRAPCWPMCVHVTVAVNVVCAGEQCTGETCVRA